jgi:hypothetical protein
MGAFLYKNVPRTGRRVFYSGFPSLVEDVPKDAIQIIKITQQAIKEGEFLPEYEDRATAFDSPCCDASRGTRFDAKSSGVSEAERPERRLS